MKLISGMTFISRFGSLVMVAAVVVLIATGNFYSPSPLVMACQIGAVALAVWARSVFAPGQFGATPTPRGQAVIRRGPYRLIRHPMYAAALLLIWATVLSHWSWLCLAVGAAVSLVLIPRIVDEERQLRERFPDYAEYARSTKALVPFVW
jgi:protein-S-isoprenylcysteine O-methyltransferase Ste14